MLTTELDIQLDVASSEERTALSCAPLKSSVQRASSSKLMSVGSGVRGGRRGGKQREEGQEHEQKGAGGSSSSSSSSSGQEGAPGFVFMPLSRAWMRRMCARESSVGSGNSI
jgi:hypothetical protein